MAAQSSRLSQGAIALGWRLVLSIDAINPGSSGNPKSFAFQSQSRLVYFKIMPSASVSTYYIQSGGYACLVLGYEI